MSDSWAILYVDGKRVGYAPATLTLPAGKHRLRAEQEGFKAAESTITLKPGDTALWSPKLREQ